MLPCLETKLTLSGETRTYSCELLHLEKGFGILRYVVDREYDIAGLKLVPGDETIALYWEDRPYTVYIWRRKSGKTAYYFNIADRVSLSQEEFRWRDLADDILVDPQGTISVLDEHELPEDLDDELNYYIIGAKEAVLASHVEIIREARNILKRKHLSTD
jgi:protein associated with RNAse G/E